MQELKITTKPLGQWIQVSPILPDAIVNGFIIANKDSELLKSIRATVVAVGSDVKNNITINDIVGYSAGALEKLVCQAPDEQIGYVYYIKEEHIIGIEE